MVCVWFNVLDQQFVLCSTDAMFWRVYKRQVPTFDPCTISPMLLKTLKERQCSCANGLPQVGTRCDLAQTTFQTSRNLFPQATSGRNGTQRHWWFSDSGSEVLTVGMKIAPFASWPRLRGLSRGHGPWGHMGTRLH